MIPTHNTCSSSFPNVSEIDSITENITYSKTDNSTTLANGKKVSKVAVGKKILTGLYNFFVKFGNILDRAITLAEPVVNKTVNFIDCKWNSLLEAIKQLKPHLENNHFILKFANFNLIINRPVINVYYY